MHSVSDWRRAVEAHIANKPFAFTSDLTREVLGKHWRELSGSDWFMLKSTMAALGWKTRKIQGVACWAPKPQSQPEPQLPL